MAERPKRENWQDAPPKNWAEREAHRISVVIQELRAGRSAQWLSDKTDELGHRVSRSVISDLETGRRRYVTTAEIAVLAAALETSPVVVLFPGPYDREVEVLPNDVCTQFEAAQWFSASGQRVSGAGAGLAAGRWRFNTRALEQWRRLEQIERQRAWLTARDGEGDRQQIAFYDEQIRDLREELGLTDE